MRSLRACGVFAVVAALAASLIPGAAQAGHSEASCSAPFHDPLLCPQPVTGGTSCMAHGVLVIERERAGFVTGSLVGDVVVDQSRSDAWVGAPIQTQDEINRQETDVTLPQIPPGTTVPGPEWLQLGQSNTGIRTPPPGSQHAHGDAQQTGIDYSHPLPLEVSASTVYSSCDADGGGAGTPIWAHGKGGVQDLEIKVLGLWTISATALEHEIYRDSAGVIYDCDTAEVGFSPPPLSLTICPPPNTELLGGALLPTVKIEANERWGPVPNAAGQQVHGGSALHVTVQYGAVSQVDVYVGYAAVAG